MHVADLETNERGNEGGEPAGPGRLAGASVLVMEDEVPVANFIKDYLAAKGCRVLVATDGRAGSELFHQERPDLVFCDLLLPKVNGFQIVEELRETAPDVLVVVMSGVYKSSKYRDELSHACCFLEKPITLEHLDRVADVLARSLARGAAAAPSRTSVSPFRRRSREPWLPTQAVPLGRVLQLLTAARRTGLLTHRVGEERTVFMLRDGLVHFVRCNDPELQLSRVLLQVGKASAGDLERAQATLSTASAPVRIGQVLVEQGTLTDTDLRHAVQLQLRKIIARAFQGVDGETMFRSETEATDEDISIDLDSRALIAAGCASFSGDEEILLGHLPDLRCRVRLAVDPADPTLKLPAAERRLLEAVAQPKPISEVMAMARLMGLKAKPLMFGMLCAGILAVVDDEADWAEHRARAIGAEQPLDPHVSPMAHVLAIESRRASGVLSVQGQGVRASLCFEGGALRWARSEDARARLGDRMVESGFIDTGELEEALQEKLRAPRKPLGRILVERGSLRADNLPHAVRAQVLMIATELLSLPAWPDARFVEGEASGGESVSVGATMTDVVMDALRTMAPKPLMGLAARLASERPELDLAALRAGRFTLSSTEESAADALSESSARVLSGLTQAEELDSDVLRVLVAALLVTPAGHLAAAS